MYITVEMVGYLCKYYPAGRSKIQLGPLFKMLLHNSSEEKRKKSVFTFYTFVVNFYSRWTINIFF